MHSHSSFFLAISASKTFDIYQLVREGALARNNLQTAIADLQA
ncbi:MAG: hypothetical protein V7K98_18135 [Nostoc sp.]